MIASACGWVGATFFWKDADCMRSSCCPQHDEYSQFLVVANLSVVDDEPGIYDRYIIKVLMNTQSLYFVKVIGPRYAPFDVTTVAMDVLFLLY